MHGFKQEMYQILSNLKNFLKILIFMGSVWPTFSENTLMLHQHDLQLGLYFVKWQLGIDRGVGQTFYESFCRIIIMAQIPRVV